MLIDSLTTNNLKYSLFLSCLLAISIQGYNYGDQGPDSWPYEVNPLCGGQRQSPIDIQKELSVYDSTLLPIIFTGYDTSSNFNVSNDGHSVQFTALSTNIQTSGSNFLQTYTLNQFHFHWGENNYQGSEHMIDGTKYPLELHLVHKANNGAIAVLGVLFDLSDSDNPSLNGILESVINEKNESFWTTINFVLFNILPNSTKLANYYRYTGSLTTPPCTEGVIWTIFEDHIPISKKQMSSFHQNVISKNFRYPQKLNSRGVFTSMKVTFTTFNSSSQNRLSLKWLEAFIFIFIFFY